MRLGTFLCVGSLMLVGLSPDGTGLATQRDSPVASAGAGRQSLLRAPQDAGEPLPGQAKQETTPVYVRGALRISGGYRYGRNVPDADVVNEWWFSKDRLAFSSTGWNSEFGGNQDLRFVLRHDARRLLMVNLTGNSYVEVALPTNPADHLSQDVAAWLKGSLVDGQMGETGRTGSVMQIACSEYQAAEWMIRFDDDRIFDRRRTLLVARDVPFEWRLADELFLDVASFFNPQPRYLSELKKKDGFVLASDESVFDGGSEVKSSFRVVEIRKAAAPAGIYDPPQGFSRKETLTISDLFNVRAVLFLYSLY